MTVILVVNLCALVMLVWAFLALWNHRNVFRSFYPLLGGLGWLFVARLLDTLVKRSLLDVHSHFGIPGDWIALLADGCDLMAAFSFAVGFIRTVRFQRAEEKRIRDLESLLPICAWCKKYRTADSQWQPIEQYLQEHSHLIITHGICPECTTRLKNTAAQRASERGRAT